jgi:DNA-nicking Smr family endonuclease
VKRRLTAEERRLWALVARTLDATAPGRAPDEAEPPKPPAAAVPPPRPASPATPPRAPATAQDLAALMAQLAAGVRHNPAPRPASRPVRHAPDTVEPRRLRRLSRERDPIEARIDLHGFGVWEAEDRLKAFILRSWENGLRAVLVVTGKGYAGEGQIRRHAGEWLASRDLRHAVAGVSHAARRHGGEGALYVALKKRRE